MKIHELKLVGDKFCDDIFYGKKKFEVRFNDRNYKVGDYIKFKAYSNSTTELKEHKVNNVIYRITYMFTNIDKYPKWLNDNYCVLGIEPINNSEMSEVMSILCEVCYADTEYNEKYRDSRTIEESEVQFLQKFVKKSDRVLDVGCGNGNPYGKFFVDLEAAYSGVDICHAQIVRLRNSMECNHLYFDDFLTAKIGGKFDVIFCAYTLSHFTHEDQYKVIEKMYELLTANGIILLLIRRDNIGLIFSNEWCGHSMLCDNPKVKYIEEIAKTLSLTLITYDYARDNNYIWVELIKDKY